MRVLRDPGLHSVLRQFSATVARATVLVVRVFPELVHEFTKFAAVSHLRPQKNRPFREGGRNVSRNTAANGERSHRPQSHDAQVRKTWRSKPSLACSRLRWYVLCKKSKEMQSLFLVMSIVQVHAQDACRCRNIVDPEVMSGPRCERGWRRWSR